MKIDELETPAAIVDLDILEQNIRRLQTYLDEHDVANRPHIKTHKIPEIAHLQVRHGAVGITVQKLGEAEIMVQAGIRDIFLPYNILGSGKLRRLKNLCRRAAVSVTADSEVTVRGLSAVFREEENSLSTLVEFDTGLGRCGVQSPAEAAELAERIHASPGLEFGGLMTYPTNENTDSFVAETRKRLEREKIQLERVSGGGTHCMWEVHEHPEITEHRAGMYVYGDRNKVRSRAMQLEECSFTIRSTVVSRPTVLRGILDAGSKCLSSDLLDLDGYGLILEYPAARIYRLSEEHAFVDFEACENRRPEIGEIVTVIPNHCCVANNLFEHVAGVRDGTVEVLWPVAARGAVT